MADIANRGLANMQLNLLVFIEDKYIFCILRYFVLLPIDTPTLSIITPIKLSNVQTKIFISIPCHIRTNAKHENDANSLPKLI